MNALIQTSIECDGRTIHQISFNLNSGETADKTAPFAGETCVVKVTPRADQRWLGKEMEVKVEAAAPTAQSGGKPYFDRAGWTTIPVTSSATFSYGDQDTFAGFATAKVTVCAMRGGSTDATASFACDGFIEHRTNSQLNITWRDDRGELASHQATVTWERHHETFTVRLPREVEGELVLTADLSEGAPFLVHGPGSGLVGTKPSS